MAEVHGVVFQRERRVQVDLTLTRGVRNTTKRMLVNGQRPRSSAELAEALPLTVFTPEGVDVVRGGPEHRRTYLTTLLTDVDPLTSEVDRAFRARAEPTQRAASRARGTATVTESTVRTRSVDERLLQRERRARDTSSTPSCESLAPLVAHYYHDLAEDESEVEVRYEPTWVTSLAAALAHSFDDDRLRGYTTVGPHRDDVELSLEGRDARRQASQGEQRSLALALRLAGHELVRERRGVDPLLLLDDVFSELDPLRANRLLSLLPAGQTLVSTASPLPAAMTPAAIIDVTRVRT